MSDSLLQQAVRRAGIEATRQRLRLRPSARPLDPGAALAALPAEPQVLFLCYGNICRSPLAERYARDLLGDRATVDSAGFFEREGRESPETAVETAAKYGVDLSTHRSERVTRSAIAESDLTVVMDVRNYRRLAREYPELTGRTWFLKPFGPDDGIEIDDPYDGGREAFETVYAQVVRAVDGLADGMRERRR